MVAGPVMTMFSDDVPPARGSRPASRRIRMDSDSDVPPASKKRKVNSGSDIQGEL